jgi:hypothetical protein
MRAVPGSKARYRTCRTLPSIDDVLGRSTNGYRGLPLSASLQPLMRVPALLEAEDLVELRPELRLLDRECEPPQLDSSRPHKHAAQCHVAVDRQLEITAKLDDRGDAPAFGDEGQARRHASPADEVGNGREIGTRGDTRVPQRLNRKTIDDNIDPEGAQKLVPLGARDSGDPAAAGACQLNNQMTNAAGRAVHEQPITSTRSQPVEQL